MSQSIRQMKGLRYNTQFHPTFNHHQRIFSSIFINDPFDENPIFTDIKAVLSILKATGVFPIFQRVSYYEIAPPAKCSEYYSVFVRGVTHFLTAVYIYILLSPDSMQWFYSNRNTDIGNKWIEISLSIFTHVTVSFYCGFCFDTFLKIINELLQVDQEIRYKFRAVPKNDCRFSGKFLAGIGIWQAYIIGSKIFNQFSKHNLTSYFLTCYFVFQNSLVIVLIVFLAALLRMIAMRFAYINLIFTRYTYKLQSKATDRMHILNAFTSMETFLGNSGFLFRLHYKLLRIYKSINECGSLILVCYMGYSFYTITENIYNLFIEITTQQELSAKVIIWGVAWLILHISLLRLLCKNCDQATREANTTTLILARIYDNNKDHQNIINKFLIKNIKQKVQFTAYGFFAINISTLFKIFSAVTTYLVILIQFKQLEDAQMEHRSSETIQE